MKAVGTVTQINLFPVKSMQGVAVTQGTLWWYGLDGDRKCAFVKSNDASSFPWLTGRDYPDLVRYGTSFADAANPASSSINVKTVSGMKHPLDDPELLRELCQRADTPIHLMKLNRGVFDAMPISVISTTTVQAVADALDEPIDARRFRANIVVEVERPTSNFPESAWLGKTLTFGGSVDDNEGRAQILTNYRIQRCRMINIDPDTSARNPSVLKKVGVLWEACAGIYGVAQQLGTIRVGDRVKVG